MIKYFLLFELLVFAIKIDGEIVISDKIDFESNETSESYIPSGDTVDFTISDSSQSRNPTRSFKQSSNFRPDILAFRERDFSKPKRSRSNCESTHNSSPLTVVNNIRIFVDGNESRVTPKNYNTCENGVCDVTVSTMKDEDGNLVTTLQLSIITRMKDIKMSDIPVIDGVRGTSPDDAINHSNYPHFIRNNVPQIYRHGPSHFQPSFGVPKNIHLRPPATNPYYLYASARHGDGFQGQEQHRWLTGRDGVDDKIGAPLSKTTAQ